MRADREKTAAKQAADEAAKKAGGQILATNSINGPPVYQPIVQLPHNDYPEVLPPPNGGMGAYPDDFGHQGGNAGG